MKPTFSWKGWGRRSSGGERDASATQFEVHTTTEEV